MIAIANRIQSASDLGSADAIGMFTVTAEIETADGRVYPCTVQATSERHLETLRADFRDTCPEGATLTVAVSRNW